MRESFDQLLQDSQEWAGELNNLSLELKGKPVFDIIVVLIKDPEKPNQYWLRKMGIETGAAQGSKAVVPYVDTKLYPLPPFDQDPIPESELEIALSWLERAEKLATSDPRVPSEMSATVGKAEYDGQKSMTIDSLLSLIGFKYFQLRQKYIEKKSRLN